MATEAAEYNLTTANLTAATSQLNDWIAFLPLANNKQNEIQQARETALKTISKVILELKNVLDPMVDSMDDDQEVKGLWFLARKVEKTNGTPTQIYLTVLSDETGAGIFNAEVEVLKPEKNKVKKGKTDPVGLVHLKPVPFGYITITIKCASYQTCEIPVFKMKKGKVLHLEARLLRDLANAA